MGKTVLNKALSCLMAVLLCTCMSPIVPLNTIPAFADSSSASDTADNPSGGSGSSDEGGATDPANGGDDTDNSGSPGNTEESNSTGGPGGTNPDLNSSSSSSDATDPDSSSSSSSAGTEGEDPDNPEDPTDPDNPDPSDESDDGVIVEDSFTGAVGDVIAMKTTGSRYWEPVWDPGNPDSYVYDESEIAGMEDMYTEHVSSFSVIYQIIGDGEVCLGIKETNGDIDQGTSNRASAFGHSIYSGSSLYDKIDYETNEGNIPSELSVPSTIKAKGTTYHVTTVADYAFCSTVPNLKSVTFSEGLKTLGTNTSGGTAGAFSTSRIQSISLPNTLETIQNAAFYGCGSLTQITIPSSVKTLGENGSNTQSPFNGCNSLSKVVFQGTQDSPSQLQNVRDGLFDGRSSLKEVELGYGMATTYVEMFKGCANLTSVALPQSLTSLAAGTFQGCTNLKSIHLPDSLTTFGENVFSGCRSLTNVDLPSALTTLPEGLFKNCSGLATVTFPQGITEIPAQFFYNCTGLKSMKNIPSTVTRIGNQAFYNCTGFTRIADNGSEGLIIPATVQEIGEGAFESCKNLAEFSFTDTASQLETIGNRAFYGAFQTSSDEATVGDIRLPRNLKNLGTAETATSATDGANVFSGSSIGKVFIPASIESIGAGAFANCAKLSMVMFESDAAPITEIRSYTFYGCSLLANVQINNDIDPVRSGGKLPTAVTTIGDFAFANCEALTRFNPSEGLQTLGTTPAAEDGTGGSQVFLNCTTLLKITIPASLVNIGGNNFKGSSINEVTFADGRTSSVPYMFAGCTNLKKVTLPSTLGTDGGEIGTHMFSGCTGLTEIDFNGCTSLGDYMFAGCRGLESITLPEYLGTNGGSIGTHVFSGCSSLTQITFADGLTSTGPYMFDTCRNLVSVDLPASLGTNGGTIGTHMFNGCTALATVNLAEGYSTGGEYMFAGCTAFTSMEIPASLVNSSYMFAGSSISSITFADGVTAIGDFAFKDCTSLESIGLPATLVTIGRNVFDGCNKLKTVNFAEGFKTIGEGMFEGFTTVETIKLPQSLETIGPRAFKDCTSLKSVSIPNKVTTIGTNAFDGCTALANVKLSTTLQNLGAHAFKGCTSLTKITLPASITEVGASVFEGCSKLASVEFGAGYSVVGDYMFSGLTALKSLTVPSTLTKIGEGTFKGCTFISDVDLSNVSEIGAQAFYGCTALTEVNLASATRIGSQAFVGTNISRLTMPTNPIDGLSISSFAECSKLTYVDMGACQVVYAGMFSGCTKLSEVVLREVTSISDHAFENCTSLTKITLGKVTSIGESAFSGCTGLAAIDLAGVNQIGKNAFAGCVKITSANIANVDSIPEGVFSGCTALQSVTMPASASVDAISANAFSGCTSLAGLDISRIATIGMNAFNGCTKLNDINISNVRTIGDGAFSGCAALTLGTDALSNVQTLCAECFKGCTNITAANLTNATSVSSDSFTDSGLVSLVVPATQTTDNVIDFNAFTRSGQITYLDFGAATTLGGLSFSAYAQSPFASIQTVKMNGVTSIPDSLFLGCMTIQSIEAKSVTSIGENAFAYCTSLSNVEFGELADIANGAFWFTANLKGMDFSHVASIGSNAFDESGITEVVLGDNVTIGLSAFGASAITTFTAGDNVTFSDITAFKSCAQLTSVSFGDNVAFSSRDFEGCSKLKTVSFGNGARIGASTFANIGSLTSASFGNDASLGDGAFYGCSGLGQVVLGTGCSINQNAFNGCSNLVTIDLSSVSQIGASAFQGCSNIKALDIRSATSIGTNAFAQCNALTSLHLPDQDGVIAFSVFNGCTNLEYVHMGGATTVANSLFRSCKKLRRIEMPNVTSVGNDAFNGCAALSDADISKVASIGDNAFKGCTSLANIDLSGVQTIGNMAFNGCNSLGVVDLAGATTLGNNAFSATNITELNLGTNLSSVGTAVFSDCAGLATLNLPEGITELGDKMFFGCKSLTTVTIPASLCQDGATIGDGVFQNCLKLANVQLGTVQTPLKTIGTNMFNGCDSLTVVDTSGGATDPDPSGLTNIDMSRVESIGAGAFANCSKLEEVNLTSVKYVGEDAFKGANVKRLTLPDDTAVIDFGAFSECDNLRYVNMGGATQIGQAQFQKCKRLEEVVLNRVTSIGAQAFQNCNKLATINLSKVQTIGDAAFDGCSELRSANISAATSLGDRAFQNCADLTTVTLSNGIASIPANAFKGCASLESANLKNATQVGENAFAGCKTLGGVTMPRVTEVKANAFAGCASLANVTATAAKTIGDGAFQDCSSLLGININNVATIGARAFMGAGLTDLGIDLQMLDSVGDSAFANTGISSLRIGKLPQNIGENVFSGCSGLETVMVPEGVQLTSAGIFSQCGNLRSIEFEGSGQEGAPLADIGQNVFAGCTSLSELDLLKVRSLGDGALDGCTAIKVADLSNIEDLNAAAFTHTAIETLTLPSSIPAASDSGSAEDPESPAPQANTLLASHMANFGTVTNLDFGGVETITPGSLDGLTHLVTASLNNVQNIDGNVFTGLQELQTVNVGQLRTLGDNAFQNCASLSAIDLQQIREIGTQAFQNCSAMTAVDLTFCETVGDRAFNNTGLLELSIGSTLENQGAYVFADNADLSKLTVADGTDIAGDNMFDNCPNLVDISLVNGVTLSGNGIFNNCVKLPGIVIHKGAQLTGDNLFSGCAALGSVSIESGVRISGSGAFKDDQAITSLSLEDGVTLVGPDMFKGCAGLTTISMPEDATDIHFKDGDAQATNIFQGCTGLTAISMPSSITLTTPGMFQDCSNITTATLPSVTVIANSAFKDCSSLQTVSGQNFLTIENGAFENCIKLKSVSTEKVTIIGDAAFKMTTNFGSIDLTSAESIGTSAFEESGIDRVVIGENLTHAGDSLFSGCLNLVALELRANAIFSSNKAFMNCSKLGTVTFQPGVKISGDDVFNGCSSLHTVTIGNDDNIEITGDRVFKGCESLTNVKLPKSLLSGKETFMDCTKLTDVDVIPKDDKTYAFADGMFKNCVSLNNIDLSKVTYFGVSAFENCAKLSKIDLQRAETIADYAFKGCRSITYANTISIKQFGVDPFYGTSLAELRLSNNLSQIGPSVVNGTAATLATVDMGAVTDIQDNTFADFSALTTVKLKELSQGDANTITVGANAFSGCDKLETCNLGGISTVGDGAFAGCSKLAVMDLSSLTALNASAFTNTAVKTLTLPKTDIIDTLDSSMLYVFKTVQTLDVGTAKALANNAFADCVDLASVKLNTVSDLGEGVFNGCANLTDIDLGGVQTIGDSTFKNCAKLANISGMDTVTSMGDDAFSGCEQIRSINLPVNITSVGARAFEGCVGITSVTFGDGFAATGAYMFKDCTGLTQITLPGSITQPAAYMFQGCTKLSTVNLGSEESPLTAVSERMFDGCTSLADIDLSKVVSVGDRAFNACHALELADLSSATSIGVGFISNTSVKTLKFSDQLTSLPENAMLSCNTPEDIDFGGIQTIRPSAFSNFTKLRTIKIDNVQSIGNSAFSSCTALDNVTFPEACAIGDSAFLSCGSMQTADLSKVASIGRRAFEFCISLNGVILNQAASVGDDAFLNCSSLRTAQLKSATNIGSNAFKGCSNLQTVVLGAVEGIGDSAFAGTPITHVNIPACIGANNATVGKNVFANCAQLEEVEITVDPDAHGNLVHIIYNGMFRDCGSLTSINLDHIDVVEDDAFNGTPLSAQLNLRELHTIGARAFAGTMVQDATLPNIETLGEGAFQGCANLKTADISHANEGAFALAANAFAQCGKLQKVVMPSNLDSLGTDAFADDAALSVIEFRGHAEDGNTSIPANGFSEAGATGLDKLVFYGTRLNPSGYDPSVQGSELFARSGSAALGAQGADSSESTASSDGDGGVSGNHIDTYVTLYFYSSVNALEADEKANTYQNSAGYVTIPYDVKFSNVAYDRIEQGSIYDSLNYYSGNGTYDSAVLNDDMDSVFTSAEGECVTTQRQRSTDTLRCYFFNCDTLAPTITLKSASYVYTGEEIKPEMSVTTDNFQLKSDQLKVTYEDNVNVGTGKVNVSLVISGVTYGTTEQTFNITPADISQAAVAEIEDQSFVDDQIMPEPEVTFNEATLEKGTDYELDYADNVNVGTASVTVRGIGNFEGSQQTVQFKIEQGILSQGTVAKPADVVYSTQAQEPELDVTMFAGTKYEKKLQKDRDYTVEFSDNVNVGTAKVVVKGAGGYTGQLTTSFDILKKDISDVEISEIAEQVFTGDEICPEFTLTDALEDGSSVVLEANRDYIATYSNNTNVGSNIGNRAPTILIKGVGNYSGEVKVKFTILKCSIENAQVEGVEDVVYNGGSFEPVPTVKLVDGDNEIELENETNYTISYSNNIQAGTATVSLRGVGNYTGTRLVNFTINPKSLDGAALSQIESQTYTGDAIEPAFTAKDGEKDLVSGRDFNFHYVNNVAPGSAADEDASKRPAAVIEGTGNYQGTRTIDFDVLRRSIEGADAVVSGNDDVTYSGQEQTPQIGVHVTSLDKTLVQDVDYEVSYKDNLNAGTATATITGINGYDGTRDVTFQVQPKSILDSSIVTTVERNYVYSGVEIKPEGSIRDSARDKIMIRDEDYAVMYENNVNAAESYSEDAPAIIVEGKGNYSGRLEVPFTIQPANIDNAQVAGVENETYNRQAHTPQPVVTLEEKQLDGSTDYSLDYSNNINAGVATVVVRGKGNYAGSVSKDFQIATKSIEDVVVTNLVEGNLADQTYTGSAIAPTIVLQDGDTSLIESHEYTITAEDNTAVGEATVTVTGVGNYSGTRQMKFNINSRDIADAQIVGAGDVTYTGQEFAPEVTVMLDGRGLVKDVDYQVAYSGNTDAGEATITISGRGGYSGSATGHFQINPRSINDVDVAHIETPTFTGSEITPALTLTDKSRDGYQLIADDGSEAASDFAVEYKNNVNAGTATDLDPPHALITGKGNYAGTRTVCFTIAPKDLGTAKIADVSAATFNGAEQKPTPAVTMGEGEGAKELVSGTDFDYVYASNTAAGTGTITVRGTNNYKGEATKTFDIQRKGLDSQDVTIEEIPDQTYTGSFVTPSVVVHDGDAVLEADKDYKVSYSNNVNSGEATSEYAAPTVTVTGLGNYQGMRSANFSIKRQSIAGARILGVQDVTYNGSAHTPLPVVILGAKVLENNSDYVVSYANNTDAGQATVNVTGMNGYTDVATFNFTIAPKNIGDGNVSVGDLNGVTYTGSALTPSLDIRDNVRNVDLREGADYTVEFANNTAAAKMDSADAPTVTIKGTGNYAGTRTTKFTIWPHSVENAVVAGLTDVDFNRQAHTPEPYVTADGRALEKGVDYKLTYSGNYAAGTATVTVNGIGNYEGTKDANFQIRPKSIASMNLTDIAAQSYTGLALRPEITLADGDFQLEAWQDYDVSYDDNIAVTDEPKVTITGKGNYQGTLNSTFDIQARSITSDGVGINIANKNVYTGSPIVPTVIVSDDVSGKVETLQNETDFTLAYANNTEAGNASSYRPPMITVEGKGNYTGTAKVAFEIEPQSLEGENGATLESVGDQVYAAGARIQPTPVVKIGEMTLMSGIDYDVTYSNNVGIGTSDGEAPPTMTITGKGNYQGTLSTTFNIVQKNIEEAMMVAFDPQTFNGNPIEPQMKLVDGGRTLVEGADYTREFSSNTNAGTATVTITGMGQYNGTKTVSFQISARSLADVQIAEIPDATFDGTSTRPTPEVRLGDVVLQKDVDYTLSYSNNQAAGTASITVTGTGNYNGMASTTYKIKAQDIAEAEIGEIEDVVYKRNSDNSVHAYEPSPAVTVRGGSTKLIRDYDYTIEYADNQEAGTATVTITGVGNYCGQVQRNFNIAKRDLADAFISAIPAQDLVVGGNTPLPNVSIDGVIIEKESDYTIEYSNNTDVGVATVKIIGMGNYTGEATTTFNIVEHPFDYQTKITIEPQTYTGSELKPSPTVSIGTKTLVEGEDYVVTSYENNIAAGSGRLFIRGIGNYSGERSESFPIIARSIVKPGDNKHETPNSGIYVVPIEEQTYTGSAISPQIVIRDGGTTLVKDKDYTTAISPSNCVNVGAYKMTVTGEGNYQGQLELSFDVVQKQLSHKDITLELTDEPVYTGAALAPGIVVKDGERELVEGTDFTKEYENDTEAATATDKDAPVVKVHGTGNYGGDRSLAFTIDRKSLDSAEIEGTSDQVYKGEPWTFDLTVTLAGQQLVEDTDFVVEYNDTNVNAGTGVATVVGIGNYKGTANKEFNIGQAALSGIVYDEPQAQPFTGQAIEPEVSISWKGVTLVQGKDYSIAYGNNVNAGVADVYITPLPGGNFKTGNQLTRHFNIEAQDIGACNASVAAQARLYTGKQVQPVPTLTLNGKTLVNGTDFAITGFGDNLTVGKGTVTVKGKGNFTGTRTIEFDISPTSISGATVVSAAPSVQYTGTALQSRPTLAFNGTTLREGTDYTLSFPSAVNAGTYTVTVTGKGNFGGKSSYRFTVTPLPLTGSVVSGTPGTYSGAAVNSTVTVVRAGKALVNGKDYTATYTNNVNAGSGTIVISGKGNYSGSAVGTFVIAKGNDAITGGTKSKTYKASVLKKKAQTFTINAKAKSPVTYKAKTYYKSGKISVAKAKKAVKIASNGKVTVAKKTAKGTYKVQVQITSSGNANLNPATFLLTMQVKVK